MAKVIVSENLNTLGNNGQFETDRSTWGFSDNANTITRSTVQKSAGLYSALVVPLSDSNNHFVPCRFIPTANKYYLIKAKVYSPSASPVGTDTAKITLRPSLNNMFFNVDVLESVDKTVHEARDGWADIEMSVKAQATISFPYTQIFIWLDSADDLNINGQIFIDQFEVYEYNEVEDPSPTCDINLIEGSTVVTNETSSGANNGSINVSASGSGTYEFSKDAGTNWQLSNLFAGLGTGIYITRVRRQTLTSCFDEYPFAVNHAPVAFDFDALVTNESISGVHDGSISITVTGTGAPYQFTKDGGITWQSGNVFNNLAPGKYYVAVKNSDGNAVVKVVTVAAGTIEIEKVWHSKNPIVLAKSAPAGYNAITNFRLYNEVRIEDVADSGVYNSKLQVELPPDNGGNVVFYLNAAFRDAFTFTPPALNESNIVRLTDRIKRFKNYTGELHETDVTPGALVASTANLALWGGIDKFNFPDLEYFSSYISAKKKFLTWAPIEKYVDRQQEDYLNFYVYGNFTSLKVRIKAYFDDGTNATSTVKTKTSTKFTELYQIPAGPANSGALLVDPTKNVLKYELSLLDQTDAVITEVRTYYVNPVTHPLSRYFMFLNSLGAFEVLRFTGQQEDKTQFSRELVQRFLPHNYNPLQGQYSVNTVTRQSTRSISSGFIKDKQAEKWHEYMIDFMSTPLLYDVSNGKRYPVVITGGDHTRADQNYERYIRIDARQAYDNESFTPKDI